MDPANVIEVYRPIPFVIGFGYNTYLALRTPTERDEKPVAEAIQRMHARRAAKAEAAAAAHPA